MKLAGMVRAVGVLCAVVALGGCGSFGASSTKPAVAAPAGGLDAKDWQVAADKCAAALVESGALKGADGRKLAVQINPTRNRVFQPVDTAALTARLQQALVRAGCATPLPGGKADARLDAETVQQKIFLGEERESRFFFRVTLTDMKTSRPIWQGGAKVSKPNPKP